MMEGSSNNLTRSWLLVSNGAMMMAWATVLRLFVRNGSMLWQHLGQDNHVASLFFCEQHLTSNLHWAVLISFVEFLNALTGLTRSQPRNVALFAAVRWIVEFLYAPHLPVCHDVSHLATALCWSLGDTIRFGCFFLDLLLPGGQLAKRVRYTVGPLLFPLGAFGEMCMALRVARRKQKWWLYALVCLWPLGFYPLMKQLLRQRNKFLTTSKSNKAAAAKVKSV